MYPQSKNFLCIPVSTADAADVNPNAIKNWCKFFMKTKLVFCNNSRRIPRNIPNCNLLDRLVFDHFVLADELFAKALRSLETCRLVNNN